MKVTVNKESDFQPFSLTIRVEKEAEYEALIEMACHDLSVPEAVYGNGTSAQARTLTILLQQINVALGAL